MAAQMVAVKVGKLAALKAESLADTMASPRVGQWAALKVANWVES